MNKFKWSAIEVLKNAKQPLHYKEITRLALELGLLETDGKTPEASMNATLAMDIKLLGSKSIFKRTAPGLFTLNEKVKTPELMKETEVAENHNDRFEIESGFTGSAGEHLVCSELLFRGFNASIMSVDVGLDIVATKDGKMYGVQVKTSNLNIYQTYVFDVRKSSFEKHESSNVYYIFVLHGEAKNEFLIVPYHEMVKLVSQKHILSVGSGKRYRVNIKFRDGNVYLGKLDNNMNYFLNNWGLIK